MSGLHVRTLGLSLGLVVGLFISPLQVTAQPSANSPEHTYDIVPSGSQGTPFGPGPTDPPATATPTATPTFTKVPPTRTVIPATPTPVPPTATATPTITPTKVTKVDKPPVCPRPPYTRAECVLNRAVNAYSCDCRQTCNECGWSLREVVDATPDRDFVCEISAGRQTIDSILHNGDKRAFAGPIPPGASLNGSLFDRGLVDAAYRGRCVGFRTSGPCGTTDTLARDAQGRVTGDIVPMPLPGRVATGYGDYAVACPAGSHFSSKASGDTSCRRCEPDVPCKHLVNMFSINDVGTGFVRQPIVTGASMSCMNAIFSSLQSDGQTHSVSVDGVFSSVAASDDRVYAYFVKLFTQAGYQNPLLGFSSGKPYRFMLGGNYGYLDDNCQVVDARKANEYKVCAEITITAFIPGSPISLLWDDGEDLHAHRTVTQFKLIPSDPDGRWYTWYASEHAPLLVSDPDHTGTITSAYQLFGNYTFGKTWRNGYEALASLDVNSDGKISDTELDTLALWFDRNQNGVSESGEVRSLREMQVVSLAYHPDYRDSKSGFFVATHGFERIKNDSIVPGPSVDWYGNSYDSKEDVAFDLQIRSDAQVLASPEGDLSFPTPIVHSGNVRAGGLSGAWAWQVQGKSPFGKATLAPKGLLTFKEFDDGVIEGHSYVQLSYAKNASPIAHSIKMFFMEGQRNGDSAASKSYTIYSQDPFGRVTSSEVSLSSDGNLLNGKSSVTIGKRPDGKAEILSYQWTATRFSERS